jgi:hypothetical protein
MSDRATKARDRLAITMIRKADAADQRAYEYICKALPPGRVVRWRHGRQWRRGTVLSVSGHSQGCRVRIRTDPGFAIVWIYALRLACLQPEDAA